MTQKDAESAVEMGLDALLSDGTGECNDANFYGFLAVRSICHMLLDQEHPLYQKINSYVQIYLVRRRDEDEKP